MFPGAGWIVGVDPADQRLGRKFVKVKAGEGREKRWELRWILPPEEVRVSRNSRPVDVVAMYV